MTLAGMASVGLIVLAVFFFGRQLLVALYGPEFGRFAAAADLRALAVLIGTLGLGATLSLKTTRQTGMLFWESVVSLVVSVVAVLALVPQFGVQGAAGSAVAKATASSLLLLSFHWRRSRKAAEAQGARGAGAAAGGALLRVAGIERVGAEVVPVVEVVPESQG